MADDENVVVMSDGTEIPITNYFDEWGEECEPDDAVTCVAGSDSYGWITIDLTEFEQITVH